MKKYAVFWWILQYCKMYYLSSVPFFGHSIHSWSFFLYQKFFCWKITAKLATRHFLGTQQLYFGLMNTVKKLHGWGQLYGGQLHTVPPDDPVLQAVWAVRGERSAGVFAPSTRRYWARSVYCSHLYIYIYIIWSFHHSTWSSSFFLAFFLQFYRKLF